MADAPNNPPNPSTDDMHWGIAYLREDIQDLRQQVRQDVQDLRQQVRQDVRDLHARIDAKFAQLLAAMVGMTGIIIGAVFAMLQMHTH